MESNSIGVEVPGGLSYTGGPLNDKNASTGAWVYPASAVMLEKAGLHTLAEYIQIWWQTIAAFIVNRPIFDPCREGGEEGL